MNETATAALQARYDRRYGTGAYAADRRFDRIVWRARVNRLGEQPVAVSGNAATRWI